MALCFLLQETLELRRGIIENDSLTTAETYNRMANGSAAEQWRQHESRVEIAAQRSARAVRQFARGLAEAAVGATSAAVVTRTRIGVQPY